MHTLVFFIKKTLPKIIPFESALFYFEAIKTNFVAKKKLINIDESKKNMKREITYHLQSKWLCIDVSPCSSLWTRPTVNR